MQYLKLIRIQNLLFILFIQYLIRHYVLAPIAVSHGIDINNPYLYLLMAATVLIAAGGYVLNDYFDVKIDAINKPDEQVVGREISRTRAMLLHQMFTFAGVVCGIVLSFILKSTTLGLLFLIIPGLLWFYSASYKRQLFVGNLVIALISGMTVFIVGMTEVIFLQKVFGGVLNDLTLFAKMYGWAGGFAFFAFMLNWIREIIKDMQDEAGDRELECRTMPIVWGHKPTKLFIYGLIVITIFLLLIVNKIYIPFPGSFTFRYIAFGIIIPLLMLGYLVFKAKNSNDFRNASGLAKFVMAAGILYAPVFHYLLTQYTIK